MITAILAPVLIASCLDFPTYFGFTKVDLTRSDDEFTYQVIVEKFKGPDGDGEAGVIADKLTSHLNAIHMDYGMLYEFDGLELEVHGVFTEPTNDKLVGVLRRLNDKGETVETTNLTCDFIE